MDVKGTLLGNPGNIDTGITSFRPMAESSACRKSLPKGGFFVFIWKNRAGGGEKCWSGGRGGTGGHGEPCATGAPDAEHLLGLLLSELVPLYEYLHCAVHHQIHAR